MTNPSPLFDRRSFLGVCSILGVGHPMSEALWRKAERAGLALPEVGQTQAQSLVVTKEMITAASQLIGLEFTEQEKDELVQTLGPTQALVIQVHQIPLANSVAPAIRFDAELPGKAVKPSIRIRLPEVPRARRTVARPATPGELAFLPVSDLSELVRSRQVTATELTRLYLDRLRKHGPTLQCVVTLTEERALEQASRADQEIASGKYRGPLHGIPWGAKDLFAVPGYPTTWGTPPYKDQVLDETATVVERLDRAGAVLVAKLSLGELAMGDVWFGGTTKNPWKTDQGASGSSAGPGSATAAGLVGFAIGTETLGSIVSPSDRNGVAGLRPTYGRVSRHGAMALSWTMDKAGPMCRSAEDCGHVLEAIHGADGRDASAVDRPFGWSPSRKTKGLRIGYLKAAFEADHPTKKQDDAVLEQFKALGVDLVPIDFTSKLPVGALRIILQAEAAAAFDELTRTNRDDLMTRQGRGTWPSNFRASRFIPAVEYINANRARTGLMGEMAALMDTVDLFVLPSFGGNMLTITNLTGHPSLTVPNGFRDDGTPTSISFIGRLWGEADLLAVGKLYQEATGFHRKHPPAFAE